MMCGVNRNEFKKRFNIALDDVYKSEIEKFTKGGFLEDDGINIRLTKRGIPVSNSVMCEFAVCNIKKYN